MPLNTHLQRQRPHFPSLHQRTGQRRDWRGYPDDGQPWGSLGWSVGPIPDPTLGSISPTTVSAAAAAITVTATGTGFIQFSTIQVDGVAVPTTYVSATSLTTSYDPVAAGTTQFTVRNPNGSVSVQRAFTVGALADDPQSVLEGTVDEVKGYVNALAMDDNRDDIVQALVDYERTHKNRATLVAWLDQQTGVE